jgi:hypothetical protein
MDNESLAPVEHVEQRIREIRGVKVILDSDLADLYGVETRTLNQAVRRNADRFPEDFVFQLTEKEKTKVITECDHLANLRFSPHLPRAFTEHGALMVAVDTSGDGQADHMIVWVPVEQAFVDLHPDRSFWQYEGRTYAFAETAVEGGYVPLGVDPWGLTAADIDTVYDVSSADRNPKAVRVGPTIAP